LIGLIVTVVQPVQIGGAHWAANNLKQWALGTMNGGEIANLPD
jgi:hypothetical protein